MKSMFEYDLVRCLYFRTAAGLSIGLNADMGTLMNKFVLFPNLCYWKHTTDVGQSLISGVTTSQQELSIGADLHYYVNPEANTNFYVGSGVALSSFKWQAGNLYRTESSLGLRFLAGLETPVSKKTRLIGEIAYKVDGTVNTVRVSLGASLDMLD